MEELLEVEELLEAELLEEVMKMVVTSAFSENVLNLGLGLFGVQSLRREGCAGGHHLVEAVLPHCPP